MKAVVIIPARYGSTRFPGKALAEIRGFDGTAKSLIRRSWETACEVNFVDAVHVATDDRRIRDHAEQFGAQVLMTSSECRNGTERCAEALKSLDADIDVVVNLQGDAPLIPPAFVEQLIYALSSDQSVGVATPVLRCDTNALGKFVQDRQENRVGATTVVFDADWRALYFSKEIIPYVGRDQVAEMAGDIFHHIGVYAYRRASLEAYAQWPEGRLETREGLEQLRYLENGEPILCVEVDARGREIQELNNPVDVGRIEAILRAERHR